MHKMGGGEKKCFVCWGKKKTKCFFGVNVCVYMSVVMNSAIGVGRIWDRDFSLLTHPDLNKRIATCPK